MAVRLTDDAKAAVAAIAERDEALVALGAMIDRMEESVANLVATREELMQKQIINYNQLRQRRIEKLDRTIDAGDTKIADARRLLDKTSEE